jgi:putative ABC transport system permease protein
MFNRLRHLARSLFTRSGVERDLDDEIRDHLDRDIADRVRHGVPLREARRQALADFGGVDHVREQLRDEHGISLAEDLARDARFAGRRIGRNPRYAALVVLTLALGIGAGTAVFSAVDGVLFKPLALERPDELMTIWQTRPAEGLLRDDFAPGNWLDLRERSRALTRIAAGNPYGVNISSEGSTERIEAWQVSEDFLPLLGLRPFLGRGFAAPDFQPGAAPAVILDHGFWTRRFGADRSLVGKTLRLDQQAVTVVGIMPRGFELPAPTDVWLPWIVSDDQRQDRFATYVRVFGRLAPRTTIEQARAELDGIAGTLAREFPRANTGVGLAVVSLEDFIVGSRRPLLFTLLGAAAMLVVVALVNVAALHLTRLERQRRETAVRGMLGASTAQLARPLVVEAAVLAALAGVIGVAFGWAGLQALHALGPADLPRLADIRLDWRAVGAAALLSSFGAAVLALFPLLRLAGGTSGSRTIAGHRFATRGRRAVVGAQIAIGLVLLVGTSLLARSFVAVLSADRGYRTDHILSFTNWVYDEYPDGAKRLEFVRSVIERLAALPGVQSVAMGSALPMADEITGEQADVIPIGTAGLPGEERIARGTLVWPTYFETLGIPLHSGRYLEMTDDGRAAPAVVVNESFVRRFFNGEDPVGRTVRLGLMGRPVERLVVGVVADTRHMRLDVPPEPGVFIPWAQQPMASLTFIMRTQADPGALAPAVTKVMYELDPRVGLARVATLDGLVDQRLRERRFLLVLLGAFAVAAVLVAAIGVFGVMSQAAVERRREIAVRMALGAAPRTILREFVTEAGWMTMTGLVAGLAVAVVATRAITQFLYQVAPFDLVSVAAAAAIVLMIALIAALLPGWRAAKTNPAGVLQES